MWLHVPILSSAPDTAASDSASMRLVPEFGLWVLSSGKPTRLQSSQVEWRRMPWIHVLSGTIWNPSRANSIADSWISSLRDSLARAPASPVSGSAPTISDGSGPRSGASPAPSARDGSSSRMSPDSSPLTVDERSRKSSGTWMRAGGLRNGTVCPRDPLAPRTSEIASFCSLPTPTASNYGLSQNGINGVGGANERPSAGRPSLTSAARSGTLRRLPTPTTNPQAPNKNSNQKNGETSLLEAARRLPTPTTRPNNHRTGHDAHGKRGPGVTLTEAAAAMRLPTPTASDSKGGVIGMSGRPHSFGSLTEGLSRLPTPRASDATKGARSIPDRDGKEGPTLVEAINQLAARGQLPTPTAQDARRNGVAGNWTEASGRHTGATLTDVAVRRLDTPSKSSTELASTGIGETLLNPRFVEWMMGLPPMWLTIPTQTNSTRPATASFRRKRVSRSRFSGTDYTKPNQLPEGQRREGTARKGVERIGSERQAQLWPDGGGDGSTG